MRIRTDLALVVVLALAACVFAAILPSSIAALRAPLCLPLVLFLPGYALARSIFAPGELRTPELITLSIAFSIAVTIVAALLLALLGVRLTTAPWMGLVAALTVAAAARAGACGRARPIELRLRFAGRAVRGAEAAGLGCALALLVGAAALGFTPLAAPASTRGTTALWLVPAPGGRHTACVGVINEQLHPESYVVSVLAAGTAVQRFGPIALAPGGRWSRAVAVGGGRPVVKAVLSLTDDATVAYRRVELRDWNIATTRC